MKILCMADIHAHFDKFRVPELPDAGLVLVAGDLTNHGLDFRGPSDGSDRREVELFRAKEWVQQLRSRYGDGSVIVIPGNHDIRCTEVEFGLGSEEPRVAKCLDDRAGCIVPIRVLTSSLCASFGLSADMPTCWDHTARTEEEDVAYWNAASLLTPSWGSHPDIILSHCPPLGILDDVGPVKLGSPGLKSYIERFRPRLVVCGHCHEWGGITEWVAPGTHWATMVVNAARSTVLVDWPEPLGWPSVDFVSVKWRHKVRW